MRSIDRDVRGEVADHRLDDADELVVDAVVGEERDGVVAADPSRRTLPASDDGPGRDEGRCQPPDGTSPVGAARTIVRERVSTAVTTRPSTSDVRKGSRRKTVRVIHVSTSVRSITVVTSPSSRLRAVAAATASTKRRADGAVLEHPQAGGGRAAGRRDHRPQRGRVAALGEQRGRADEQLRRQRSTPAAGAARRHAGVDSASATRNT